MGINKRNIIGYITIITSVLLITISFLYRNTNIMTIGIILLVVSTLFTVIISSLELFRRDKELDIEKLEEQGLTIVKCNKCNKTNVFEDIFCIYCGEKLVMSDEKLQE